MDITGGIAAATQALGIAKALRGIEKEYDAATYKAQIVDLINSLTDAKLALSDAKDGIAERDREIERLRANFDAKSALVKGQGDYNYLTDDNGKRVGYPVCPKCEQVEGRVIQLKEHEFSGKSRCPACLEVYHPVISYLPQGSGFETKQDKEGAEWRAVNDDSRRYRDSGYF